MKKTIAYKDYTVNILVIEPNGIWAMVRREGTQGTPVCVRMAELKNITVHSEKAGLSCVCQLCSDGRKSGMKARG